MIEDVGLLHSTVWSSFQARLHKLLFLISHNLILHYCSPILQRSLYSIHRVVAVHGHLFLSWDCLVLFWLELTYLLIEQTPLFSDRSLAYGIVVVDMLPCSSWVPVLSSAMLLSTRNLYIIILDLPKLEVFHFPWILLLLLIEIWGFPKTSRSQLGK